MTHGHDHGELDFGGFKAEEITALTPEGVADGFMIEPLHVDITVQLSAGEGFLPAEAMKEVVVHALQDAGFETDAAEFLAKADAALSDMEVLVNAVLFVNVV